MNDTSSDSFGAAESLSVMVEGEVGCVSCGYNLRGLRTSAVCPECGTPVWKSVRGDQLEYASSEYVSSLHRGAQFVVGGILTYVLVMIGTLFFGFLAPNLTIGTGGAQLFFLIVTVLSVGSTIAIAVGWWWLSAPNPAAIDPNAGNSARQIVRIMAIASIVSTGVKHGFSVFQTNTPMGAPTSGTGLGLALLITLVGLAIFAIAFFAQMVYLKWLAPRIPNPWVLKRAKLMMWLGPVLFVPGSLCIGLGPLVALILYYNLVTRVRADLKAILGRMESVA